MIKISNYDISVDQHMRDSEVSVDAYSIRHIVGINPDEITIHGTLDFVTTTDKHMGLTPGLSLYILGEDELIDNFKLVDENFKLRQEIIELKSKVEDLKSRAEKDQRWKTTLQHRCDRLTKANKELATSLSEANDELHSAKVILDRPMAMSITTDCVTLYPYESCEKEFREAIKTMVEEYEELEDSFGLLKKNFDIMNKDYGQSLIVSRTFGWGTSYQKLYKPDDIIDAMERLDKLSGRHATNLRSAVCYVEAAYTDLKDSCMRSVEVKHVLSDGEINQRVYHDYELDIFKQRLDNITGKKSRGLSTAIENVEKTYKELTKKLSDILEYNVSPDDIHFETLSEATDALADCDVSVTDRSVWGIGHSFNYKFSRNDETSSAFGDFEFNIPFDPVLSVKERNDMDDRALLRCMEAIFYIYRKGVVFNGSTK